MDNYELVLREVMAAVFEISVVDISERTSVDTIDKWDSLKHVSLVVALEEEFELEFHEEEILLMLNFEAILKLINRKLI